MDVVNILLFALCEHICEELVQLHLAIERSSAIQIAALICYILIDAVSELICGNFFQMDLPTGRSTSKVRHELI